MLKNSYIHNVIQQVLKTPPKLILPEQNNPRIKKAAKLLEKLGFNIINIKDYNDNNSYIEHIKRKKFTNNWTENMIEQILRFNIYFN